MIELGKIRDHNREKRKAGPGFRDRDQSRDVSDRLEIPESQGEERRAAHVKVVDETAGCTERLKVRARRPVQAGEAKQETQRPDTGKAELRQRAIDGEKPLATTFGAKQRRCPAP